VDSLFQVALHLPSFTLAQVKSFGALSLSFTHTHTHIGRPAPTLYGAGVYNTFVPGSCRVCTVARAGHTRFGDASSLVQVKSFGALDFSMERPLSMLSLEQVIPPNQVLNIKF